jgi:hypothetical protein
MDDEFTVLDESNLPEYLRHNIEELKLGLKDPNCLVLDCLVEELRSSINVAYYDGWITQAEAGYLRNKFIHFRQSLVAMARRSTVAGRGQGLQTSAFRRRPIPYPVQGSCRQYSFR